jgi:hypothetical protein
VACRGDPAVACRTKPAFKGCDMRPLPPCRGDPAVACRTKPAFKGFVATTNPSVVNAACIIFPPKNV